MLLLLLLLLLLILILSLSPQSGTLCVYIVPVNDIVVHLVSNLGVVAGSAKEQYHVLAVSVCWASHTQCVCKEGQDRIT